MEQTSQVNKISEMLQAISTNKKVDMDFIDYIEESAYGYKESEIKPLLGQNPDYIMKNLLKHKPEEEGGLVAIYGFYYQMLVFIDYMVEAIQGKWSFLSLEYHDDIIAGNEDQEVVRFIQVKTSSRPTISISDSNVHIYSRAKSNIDGPSKGKIRNNSWLDKVIDNATYVKDLDLVMEFDLVTDYSLYSSSKINIDIYNENSRGKIIEDDDPLYERLISSCFDKEGKEIDYNEKYGKGLKELLGNVCFDKKPKIPEYIKCLCTSLSETLGNGIRIDRSDINWLVGELLSKCSYRESGPILFLNRDNIEEYRQALKTKAVANARTTVYKVDAEELLNRCFTNILNKITDCETKKELEIQMEKYKYVILSKVNETNTLQSIINRFIDGERPRFGDDEKDYSEDLSIFIRTSLLLFLIHEKFLISEKFETLLVKETLSSSNEKLNIGFLNLGLELELDEGIELLTSIISKASEEEQIEMLMKNSSLYTVFHGDSITENEPIIVEIDISNQPKVQRLEKGFKSNDVGPVITIVPDRPLKDLYPQIRRSQNINAFKEKVEETWTSLKGV
ncbi:hypothetical protein ACNRWW_02750 [Metabacillus sp. HB246100]